MRLTSNPIGEVDHEDNKTANPAACAHRRDGRIRIIPLPILAMFVALVSCAINPIHRYSFTDYTGLGREIHFVGLSNYVTVFTNQTFVWRCDYGHLFAATTTVSLPF